MGLSMEIEKKEVLKENFNFNKNCFLDYDHIDTLKDKLRIKGEINNIANFENEIYES
jgi:hypothetical protein